MTQDHEKQPRATKPATETESKAIRVRTNVRAGVIAPKDSNTGLSIGRRT